MSTTTNNNYYITIAGYKLYFKKDFGYIPKPGGGHTGVKWNFDYDAMSSNSDGVIKNARKILFISEPWAPDAYADPTEPREPFEVFYEYNNIICWRRIWHILRMVVILSN